MAAGAGFIESGARAGRTHVSRTALLNEIDAELARTGVVELCGPWGYGRTTLLRDYARTAHLRAPARPVVRVDFASCEAQTFLAGNRAPLVQWLNRGSRGGSSRAVDRLVEQVAAREAGRSRDRQGDVPRHAQRAFKPDASDVRARIPARFASDEVLLVYAHLAAYAPGWCSRLERGVLEGELSFRELPLVVIDNLPRMDEGRLGQFAEALSLWSRAGARILMACAPSAWIPRSLLPEVFVVDSSALGVSADELALWSREMPFPVGVDVPALTKGVPMLVDMCRLVRGGDPACDAGFLRASDRVLSHCLDELMCRAAERARWAMVMLGEGTLADLAGVGASLRDDELSLLAQTFPLFGIDLLKGTFCCIPIRRDRTSEALVRAVSGDERLAARCAELLVGRGMFGRAGELASLLSDRGRMLLYDRQPDAFANVANGGCIERCMKAFSVEEADGGLAHAHIGLARLLQLYAIARDIPARTLPAGVVHMTAGASGGALHAVRCVLGFWKGYAGTPSAACASGEDDPAGTAGSDADAGQPPRGCGVDAVVYALGVAGLQGDKKLYAAQLALLSEKAALSRGGLAEAVYAFHAVACGIVCGCTEEALAFVEPLAGAAVDLSKGTVDSVSGALLLAARAVARLMVEKPSATRVCAEATEDVRRARRFSEEHVVEPLTAVLVLCEAFCLLVGGEERQAAPLLARCRARWSVQGTMLGQLVACLGIAVTDLARDAVNQAAAVARTAESLAQRMGVRRAVWLARLFETVAAVRNGSASDLDRRLLEASLRQNALHPNVSVALDLELALLYASRGDVTAARDILQCVGLFGDPGACRLMVVAVRALGKSRSPVLELLPRALRLEYESVRPSLAARCRVPGGLQGAGLVPVGFADGGTHTQGLTVRLLGGLRFELNGRSMGDAGWGRRKSRDVLIVLALYPETPVSRDALLEILWPGAQPTVTLRNNLNTILSNLRSSLGQRGDGPAFVVTQHDLVALNLELVDVDVLRFERLARSTLSLSRVKDGPEIIEACGTLEGLFQTGFAPEFKDMPRRVVQRVHEIEELFIDCMLFGVTAALDVDDVQVAQFFARAAARVEPERADVRLALDEVTRELDLRRVADDDGEADGRAPAGEETGSVRGEEVVAVPC